MNLNIRENFQICISVLLSILEVSVEAIMDDSILTNRPVEMKKILGVGGGLPIIYCRPPWLAGEENFLFQIV